MKRIGILGGTTPESTVSYYRFITREYVRRFGDHGYPEILIYSVSFQRYIGWMTDGDWGSLADGAIAGLLALSAAGAEIGLMATNTFHKVFEEVAAAVPMPMISILDVVAGRLADHGCHRAGLLGTRITMSDAFYPNHLAERGIDTIVPSAEDQNEVDRMIFDELDHGLIEPASKASLLAVAGRLIAEGADGVILGCTELPLLLTEGDLPVPVLDTASLHAEAALEAAIA